MDTKTPLDTRTKNRLKALQAALSETEACITCGGPEVEQALVDAGSSVGEWLMHLERTLLAVHVLLMA